MNPNLPSNPETAGESASTVTVHDLLMRWRGGYACPDDVIIIAAVAQALEGKISTLRHFNAACLQDRVRLANELYNTIVTGDRSLASSSEPISGRLIVGWWT